MSARDYQAWLRSVLQEAFDESWRQLSWRGGLPPLDGLYSILPHELGPEVKEKLIDLALGVDWPDAERACTDSDAWLIKLYAAILMAAEGCYLAKSDAAACAYYAFRIGDLIRKTSDLRTFSATPSDWHDGKVEKWAKQGSMSEIALTNGRLRGTAKQKETAAKLQRDVREFAVGYFKMNPGRTNTDCVRELRKSGIRGEAKNRSDWFLEKAIQGCKKKALSDTQA